jgi:transposase
MAAEYVPELNNIERCWRDLKQNHLANRTFTDVDDLDRTIHQAVNDLNRERKPLSSAGLPKVAYPRTEKR